MTLAEFENEFNRLRSDARHLAQVARDHRLRRVAALLADADNGPFDDIAEELAEWRYGGHAGEFGPRRAGGKQRKARGGSLIAVAKALKQAWR